SRVCKTDIAILRLSIYTLLFQKDMDKRIVINEAIMLAKEFSPNASYKYVNAVLDKVSSGE
ncbi:MAG: N utilization substance protein B, partial [Spirochaetaceae bacterium]|nr:N utilization substance protein B [Spirochaetaceae bacterium]